MYLSKRKFLVEPGIVLGGSTVILTLGCSRVWVDDNCSVSGVPVIEFEVG